MGSTLIHIILGDLALRQVVLPLQRNLPDTSEISKCWKSVTQHFIDNDEHVSFGRSPVVPQASFTAPLDLGSIQKFSCQQLYPCTFSDNVTPVRNALLVLSTIHTLCVNSYINYFTCIFWCGYLKKKKKDKRKISFPSGRTFTKSGGRANELSGISSYKDSKSYGSGPL